MKTVSRVHEKRARGEKTFPLLRIGGKWLTAHCQIGDHYRVINTDRRDELVIQFIR